MKTNTLLKGRWGDLTLISFPGGRWTLMLAVYRRVGCVTRSRCAYEVKLGRSFFIRRRGCSRADFEHWVRFVRATSGPIPGLD